jgi:hypothetical protein
MPKKIVALTDYIAAGDAALLLTAKMGRPISPKYIRKLANRKKLPSVRVEQMGNRLLYHRGDIEASTIRERKG